MGQKNEQILGENYEKIVKSSPIIKKNWDVMEKNNYDFRV